MKRVTPGLVIGLPIGGGRIRLAKVLFCSKYYRNVILLGLSNRVVPEGSKIENWEPQEFTWRRVYASAEAIRKARWPVIGELALDKAEGDASMRIVAGSVWLNDTEIRVANDDDQKTLPKMLVAGHALVEKWAGLQAEPGGFT